MKDFQVAVDRDKCGTDMAEWVAEIRTISERVNKMESHIQGVLPLHAAADSAFIFQLNEARCRIEQEEKARVLWGQQLVKSHDAALLPLHTLIEDEKKVRQTGFSNLQSMIHSLRADVDMELSRHSKQIEALKRVVTQMIKEDVDSEKAERTPAHQFMRSSIQNFFHRIEHLKQECISNEEMTRKLLLDEERARTSQLATIQEGFKGWKQEVEVELKNLKEVTEHRLWHRQGDADLLRHVDEVTSLFQQERINHEVFEASLKKEMLELKELQQHECQNVKTSLNRGLQTISGKMEDRIMRIQLHFKEEIEQCRFTCQGLEVRIRGIIQATEDHQQQNGVGNRVGIVGSHDELEQQPPKKKGNPHLALESSAGLNEHIGCSDRYDMLGRVRAMSRTIKAEIDNVEEKRKCVKQNGSSACLKRSDRVHNEDLVSSLFEQW